MRRWATILFVALVALAFAAPAFAQDAGYEEPAGTEGVIPIEDEPVTPPGPDRPDTPPGRDSSTTRTTPLGQTGDLADTGFGVTTGMIAAAVFLLVGGALVVGTRRRRGSDAA